MYILWDVKTGHFPIHSGRNHFLELTAHFVRSIIKSRLLFHFALEGDPMQEKREKIRYLDNIKYMFQNWAKWNAKSFVYLLVWVPALIVVPMLGAYVPKAMIDSIIAGVSIPQLVLKITLISGGFVSTARMMRCWSRPANIAAFGTRRPSITHSDRSLFYKNTRSYDRVFLHAFAVLVTWWWSRSRRRARRSLRLPLPGRRAKRCPAQSLRPVPRCRCGRCLWHRTSA